MSVIYPQISKPGGLWIGSLCRHIRPSRCRDTHLFLYLPTLTKSSLLPLPPSTLQPRPPHPHPSPIVARLYGCIALPAPPSVFVHP